IQNLLILYHLRMDKGHGMNFYVTAGSETPRLLRRGVSLIPKDLLRLYGDRSTVKSGDDTRRIIARRTPGLDTSPVMVAVDRPGQSPVALHEVNLGFFSAMGLGIKLDLDGVRIEVIQVNRYRKAVMTAFLLQVQTAE